MASEYVSVNKWVLGVVLAFVPMVLGWGVSMEVRTAQQTERIEANAKEDERIKKEIAKIEGKYEALRDQGSSMSTTLAALNSTVQNLSANVKELRDAINESNDRR